LINSNSCEVKALSQQSGGYLAATDGSSAPRAAISRMSCVIFIEQYFGPHMLQKLGCRLPPLKARRR